MNLPGLWWFWGGVTLPQLLLAVAGDVPLRITLFFPVVFGAYLLLNRTRPFLTIAARLPGPWRVKGTVTAVLMLGLYEWVKHW